MVEAIPSSNPINSVISKPDGYVPIKVMKTVGKSMSPIPTTKAANDRASFLVNLGLIGNLVTKSYSVNFFI